MALQEVAPVSPHPVKDYITTEWFFRKSCQWCKLDWWRIIQIRSTWTWTVTWSHIHLLNGFAMTSDFALALTTSSVVCWSPGAEAGLSVSAVITGLDSSSISETNPNQTSDWELKATVSDILWSVPSSQTSFRRLLILSFQFTLQR